MVALLPPLVARPSARTLIHSRSERTPGAPARRPHAPRFYNTLLMTAIVMGRAIGAVQGKPD